MATQQTQTSKPVDEQARFDAIMAELQSQTQQVHDARAQASQPVVPIAAPTEQTDATTTPAPDAPQVPDSAPASTKGQQGWRAKMQTAVMGGMKKGVDVEKGIAGGVIRAPGQLLGATLDAASDVSSAIANAIPG